VSDDLQLPMLEPPPGGLAKLRARLDRDDRARMRWWWLAVPVVAAALALVLLRHDPPRSPIAAVPALLPDPQMGTAFYWVAPSVEPAAPRAAEPVYVDLSTRTITP
jgi:hypothetical protein